MPHGNELKFLALAHERLQQSTYLVSVTMASVVDARRQIAEARQTLARSQAMLRDLDRPGHHQNQKRNNI